MDTHLHKVCQPRRASSPLLKATCPTPNDPVTPSHRARNQIGSMCSAWEEDQSHHLLEARREQGRSTPTTRHHNKTRVNRKIHLRGNSSCPPSPHTQPKPQTSTEVAMRSTTCAAPNPAPQHAPYPPVPVALELSLRNHPYHPFQEQAVYHKSSANPLHHPYPTRNPHY